MKDLLLHLCGYPFDETKREPLSKLISEVQNWHEFVELINAHGIIALAAYNIKEAGLDKMIPIDAMAILENGYMQSMVRNTWLTERWREVNEILTAAGIKHILLKGMALEHTIYGSRGLRQMNDNDILIKRDDAIKAWYLLQKEGFLPETLKSPLHEKMMADIGKHLPPLYKNGYAIEIHHKLFNHKITDEVDYGDLFDDAAEILIGDAKARILPEAVQKLYLIDHFERHKMEGNCQLRLYADIKLLDNNCKIELPDSFVSNPQQEGKLLYIKAAYKATIKSVITKYRFRFLLGDIFPSVKWMKERYKCSGFKALFLYPLRIGKVLWLV